MRRPALCGFMGFHSRSPLIKWDMLFSNVPLDAFGVGGVSENGKNQAHEEAPSVVLPQLALGEASFQWALSMTRQAQSSSVVMNRFPCYESRWNGA